MEGVVGYCCCVCVYVVFYWFRIWWILLVGRCTHLFSMAHRLIYDCWHIRHTRLSILVIIIIIAVFNLLLCRRINRIIGEYGLWSKRKENMLSILPVSHALIILIMHSRIWHGIVDVTVPLRLFPSTTPNATYDFSIYMETLNWLFIYA